MDGTFVKELAERMATAGTTPAGISALPPGWTLHDELGYVKPGPTADALKVYSLGAVRDYLAANRDTLPLERLVVHVVSPQIVRVLGPIRDRTHDREMFVEATALNLTDGFLGKWMAPDEFIIGLQTRFADAGDRLAVLRLFSNISHEAVHTSSDDGVTQTVTAKTGIVLKADVPVPNPIAMIPFRTFREVEQPPSLFALRVNQNAQAGIFEADGGAWRLAAVEAIGMWLSRALAVAEVNVPVVA